MIDNIIHLCSGGLSKSGHHCSRKQGKQTRRSLDLQNNPVQERVRSSQKKSALSSCKLREIQMCKRVLRVIRVAWPIASVAIALAATTCLSNLTGCSTIWLLLPAMLLIWMPLHGLGVLTMVLFELEIRASYFLQND